MDSYRIAVLGAGGVGKACVILRLTRDTFDTVYVPTIQDLFEKNMLFNNKWYRLVVINTASQDEMQRITNLAIKSVDACVIMYSCTSTLSFDEVPKFYERVEQAMLPSKPKVVIVGNKCDLESERAVTQEQGTRYAESVGAPCIECSAKANINIDKIFMGCLEQLLGVRAKERKQPAVAGKTQKGKDDQKKKGKNDKKKAEVKGCCDVL
jgi:small GTP-binding protein